MRLAVVLMLAGLALTFAELYDVAEGIGWWGLVTFSLGTILALFLALSGELRDQHKLGRGQS